MRSQSRSSAKHVRRVNGALSVNAPCRVLKSVSAETIKLQVTEDELWHLATDIACLRASNFRAIDTATAREDDVRRARDELVALIRRNPTHR